MFAGERERAIFAAAPTAYAPVLSGDCIVTFAETGERTPGQVQFGVIYGGRIYFFASAEAQARFMAAPARYVHADLADGGRCLVSRVEKNRDVPGLPETAVLVGGMRRLFAGAYEQSLYLQQPARYEAGSPNPLRLPQLAASSSGGWRARGSTPDGAAGAPTLADDATGAAAEAADGSAGPTPADGKASGGAAGEEEQLDSDPAMGGYCPVTLRDRGSWVRGRYDDRVVVEGLLFFTAGPAEHDAFLANPTRYIPALGGECAVSLVDDREHVRGSIFHAAEYQGRMFLFADAERKAAFKAEPQRYAAADFAFGGDCAVTLAETGRKEPGLPEFTAWREGLLYRFAGQEQLAKFLATPEKYVQKVEK